LQFNSHNLVNSLKLFFYLFKWLVQNFPPNGEKTIANHNYIQQQQQKIK